MIDKLKELLNKGEYLPIMETFYSIQGEGYNTGTPSFFIRIGGCDMGCKWCDVKESWNDKIHPLTDVNNVLNEALKVKSRKIVVTGGEPMKYNLDFLCQLLKNNGFEIHLETSGVFDISGEWDWICFSPKIKDEGKNVFYEKAHELKIIIENESDFERLKFYEEKINKNCRLSLQPEWSKINNMLPKIIDFVKENPVWNVSLQAHKYMRIP